ncbi:hypothetical protein A2892_01915 [Candidatus Woesebacteria bacterium RIFCSPLOWO2_01_FULL_39_10b]|uniref:Maf-like protein n=1 Tax=Candidatus Woesebacteria bacterium RIFCSPLOWO2_01_FULL_39_10b TaxID=1802517 RepID=A0A1F8BBQ6_9BACT|nr:MAG: hypothetical protein A2892_01915 [Candidatus Woesebacteria bacterium RIFCSPLOWO2_01_FULL_39_10b]
MAFAQDMLNAKCLLEEKGYRVVLPEGTDEYCKGKLKKLANGWGTVEGAKRKIDNDLIKKHYNEIKDGDAILVINKSKNGIKNYIGGNSFLEMGFAYILNKKIYTLNDLPDSLPIFYQELIAMQPISLRGDLNKIKNG